MRRSVATLAVLLLAASPSGAATRPIPAPVFAKLRLEGPYMVRVRTGGKTSVVAHGPQAGLDKLLVEKRDGVLVISTVKGWNRVSAAWRKNDNILIDISVPMLEAVELSGSGNINIDRIRASNFAARLAGSGDLGIASLDTSRLAAALSGSGDLSVAGRTGRAELSVSGSGDLRAPGLAVDLLAASVAGSGDISVGSTRVARTNIAGSGNITIAGRPRCTTAKTGSGNVKCGG